MPSLNINRLRRTFVAIIAYIFFIIAILILNNMNLLWNTAHKFVIEHRFMEVRNGNRVDYVIEHEKMNVSRATSIVLTNEAHVIADVADLCPVTPPGLVGAISVNKHDTEWEWRILENNYAAIYNIKLGGQWKPTTCKARNRVAIVVPYRDRLYQLKVFIRHMHPFLQKQQLDYGIYIVEMAAGIGFNRAMLLNIGFVESLKIHDYQCFMFHDVDLLPENDYNIYSCPQQNSPRHMSAAIDKYHYRLPYHDIFGGVSSLTKEQMNKVNGFSNVYFGWGSEDDDLQRRIVGHGMTITRYPLSVSRYKMISHKQEWKNPIRTPLLLKSKQRWKDDGLRNNLKYNVTSLELRPVYTLVKVYINETEVTKNYTKLMDHALKVKIQKEKVIAAKKT